MNVATTHLHPLPSALSQPDRIRRERRHRIGAHDIDEAALATFNALLGRLDLRHAALGRDQLASAARDLADRPGEARASPCIHERMRRAGAIDRMLSDADWRAPPAAIASAQLVIGYVRDRRDLIPDALPKVGRLDDAIVVDAAWTTLAPEVRDYLDFCRLRQVERELGNGHGFGREDWEAARSAEAQWIEHCQRVSETSYLTEAPAHFRVC